MTEEQKNQTETFKNRHNTYATRAQERHEARMAKLAAREARRAERSQRPRKDWTFEVKAGEKVYCFSWHWHPAEAEPQATEEVRTQDLATEQGLDLQ